jgi:tetratricopeptide (TPR) repeat protein
MKLIIIGIAFFLVATINIGCANNNETVKEPPANSETQNESAQVIDDDNQDFVVWDLSISIARNLNDSSERAILLMLIAERLADAARYSKAVDIANEINDAFLKSLALTSIANSMLISFERDMAIETLNQALEVCNQMEASLDKSSILSRIASCYKNTGDLEKADEIAEQSKLIMDDIRKDFSITDLGDNTMLDILEHIDTTCIDAESYADNSEFENALNTVKTFDDAPSAASALAYIALCLDDTDIEITDNMRQAINEISKKWIKQ